MTTDWLKQVREIAVLDKFVDRLDIDQQTRMPPGSAELQEKDAGIVSVMHHDKLVDKRFVEATQELFAQVDSLEYALAVCVRSMHRKVMREIRKTGDLVRAHAEAKSRATQAWQEAKKGEGNFSLFAPAFKELVARSREVGAAITTTGNPYDGHLEGFEPGLTQERALELCEDYRAQSRALITRLRTAERPDTSILDLPYPREEILAFCRGVGHRMGVDPNQSAHGMAPHPCTVEINPSYVRMYTWLEYKGFREELTANLHEDGHGLHHLGFSNEWAHTPMAGCSSFGINESQSTFWERMIGASGEFWEFYFKFLQERMPALLQGQTWQRMYRAMNVVKPGLKPGLIRVEADTLTYILHILIRTRIEADLMNGVMDVDDVPDAWNGMYHAILDVAVPNDRDGCLQDGHWAWGYFGYYPSYAIGLMIAAQIAQHLQRKLSLWGLVASGDFAPITAWQRINIHQKGDAHSADELVKAAMGSPLSAKPLVQIMTDRLSDVYAISLARV